MRFGLKETTITQINTVLAQYPQVESAIIYGSRAKGNYKPGSDIDLTLTGDKVDLSLIHKIELALDDLLLPYTIDLSAYRHLSNPDLIDHIDRVGILFYRADSRDEWRGYTLREVVDKFIDYRGKTPFKSESGIPLVTAKIIKNGTIETPTEFIPEELYETHMTRGLPKINDVLLTVEAPLGEVALVKDERIALAQRIITLRGKKDKLDNIFLKYSLQGRVMQHRLKGRATGTTVQGIKSAELKKVRIDLPPLPEQRRIATVLSTLDAKIDLLRRQNHTLEQIAQTLFKRWFVAFEFPTTVNSEKRIVNSEGSEKQKVNSEEPDNYSLFTNHYSLPYKSSGGAMVASELGEIPEGWRVGAMHEVIEVRDGTHDSPKQSDDGFPLITSKHLGKQGIDFDRAYLISEQDYIDVNKRSKVDRYDILLSMIGTVGILYFVLDKEINFAIKNIGLFKSSQDETLAEYIYLFLSSNYGKYYFTTRIAGTTQSYLTLGSLREMPIILPDSKTKESFKALVKPLFEKMYSGNQQIQTLTRLRNTLLPKLMSGKLRVNSG